MIRSAIYIPGNREKMLAKAGRLAADAVILDLEDAVPYAEKDRARALVRESLAHIDGPKRFVRINAEGSGLTEKDIRGVFCNRLDGIYLPKVESSHQVLRIDALLTELETANGFEPGRVQVQVIFESALGILNAYPILAASPERIRRAGWGAADLKRDIGLWSGTTLWDEEGRDRIFPQSQLVMASRAAGRQPPQDSVFGRVKDLDGLRKEALHARRLGFGGKSAIHPDQVAVINEVFSPTAEELTYAHKVVDAFEKAKQEGSGTLMVGNEFVDVAVVDNALRLLERHSA